MNTTRLHPSLSAACLVALVAASPGQYDPEAAEPIPRLRGSLVLGGGGDLPERAEEYFTRLAGGATAELLILRTGPEEAAAGNAERFGGRAKVLDLAGPVPDDAVSRLAAASGVWIGDGDPVAFAGRFRGGAIETALREVIGRGGVVGANGPIIRALTKVMVGGAGAAGLDLVPGSVIDHDFSRPEGRDEILAKIAAQPVVVGLGVDRGTVMILYQRFIDVLGEGSVYGCVAASAKRPLRIDRIDPRVSPASQRQARPSGSNGRRRGEGSAGRPGRGAGRAGGRGAGAFRPQRLGDLIALSRSAQARVAPRFPGWSPAPPEVAKGTLILIGGGGLPPGLMRRFIELAGGKDAPLLFVPCEEREDVETPRMLQTWRQLGATDVDWIHTKDRKAANGDEKLLAKIRRARGVFFGGGRQWNLVDSYQHTKAHELMHQVLARGGVIAGSSAGASIQASYMVRGNPLGNLDAMAEGYESGLGFLTGVGVDQHFSQRGRLRDMTGVVGTYPELLGIGLDEASAILVRGTVAEAFCREGRRVHIYDRRRPVVPGQPDYLLLESGQRFDLKARRRLEPQRKSEQGEAGAGQAAKKVVR